jgi:NitT/TauT family transport system permease protein
MIIPFLLLGLWQIFSWIAGEFVLPSPQTTLKVLLEGIERGWLWQNLRITLLETFLAFILAAIMGLCAGFFLGTRSFWRETLEPIILSTYAIPKVTLYPIFLFLFKLGLSSKVAFGWFHGVFPVLILTQNAVETVRPVFLKVGQSLRLSPLQIFTQIVFPAVLPSLIAGLRLGFNVTFLGVILGEMFASKQGLGFLLTASSEAFDMPKILAVIVVLAGIAMGVNAGFYILERKVKSNYQLVLFQSLISAVPSVKF